jgi:tetratricopeptide (TPR) repeat protein
MGYKIAALQLGADRLEYSRAVSPLHVANETFLVASTIERCPKTMMLRELVTNAVEAAAQTQAGQPAVTISSKSVEGAEKLCIWNTGPGLSAEELHAICDLASTLHKQTGLDRNFGMGAKVASLPSNKHGLRFRSCKAGVVSEVTLGQRGGTYGRLSYRLPSGEAATCIDATNSCQAEGGYNLSQDWTEVVLLGNHADQNTVHSPYDEDPRTAPDWVADYLCHRYYRMPPGIALDVQLGAPVWRFAGFARRQGVFDRMESVLTQAGIVVHYAFCAAAAAVSNDGLPGAAGMAALVWRDEIYGLRTGGDWVLDAPSYGIPFGAGNVAVFVELPESFGVQPEVYRQFLRYRDGDQRQVLTGDFAALVRTAMPGWLRDIIAAFGPPTMDYTAAVTDELREMLVELGVRPVWRDANVPRSGAPKPSPNTADRPAGPRSYEKPPEIITLREPAQLDERDLQGRAGRYYPAAHQLFVNLTYSAVTRAAIQLEQAFQGAPDAVLRQQVAADLAEWMVTLQAGRGLVYALAKSDAGWQQDAVVRAYSPESLSIMADGFAALMPMARDRMAERLGMQRLADAASSLSSRAAADIRMATELIDAQQAARRAQGTSGANPAPFLTRVSTIYMQRGDMAAALEWARRAVDAAPQDPWAHHHMSNLLLQHGDMEGAQAAVERAIATAPTVPSAILRQAGAVAAKRRDTAGALSWIRRAIEAAPEDAWNHHQLATLLLQQRDLDGAEASARQALELEQNRPAAIMRQLSSVLAQRKDIPAALEIARQAIEADPLDEWNYHHLAGLLMQQKDLAGAETAAMRGLDYARTRPGAILRQISAIHAQRQDVPMARDWARRALDADPNDPWNHHNLSSLLLRQGDVDGAEKAARRALAVSPLPLAPLERQLSSVLAERRDMPAAIEAANRALKADEDDAWSYHQLAYLLSQQGKLDEAEAVTRHAIGLQPGQSAMLRQLSSICSRQGDTQAAFAAADEAITANPSDPWNHLHLSSLFMQQGDLDKAEEAVLRALGDGDAEDSPAGQRLAAIRRQRQPVPVTD